ncbi:hypothetical protein Sjap_014279 [Stephania japonica]|uniref:Pentatricopeptide repeat-containing protein n=1 Tax=Stephania japonica TaxID=461633 RepID=A0AAP0IZC0_9MAGN
MIREGEMIHGLLEKSDFDEDESVVLFNHLAHMYAKCLDYVAARKVFDKMPLRNMFSWTVMIVGSVDNGLFGDGFLYFVEMQSCGIRPDKFAYSSLLQCCIGLGSISLGKIVHGLVIKSGLSDQVFVGTSLLDMYAKLGEIESSVQVFGAMNDLNQVSWNAMISGLTSNELHLEAFCYFLEMKKKGFAPNRSTFASVLKAIGRLGDIKLGREVHDHVRELCMEFNVVVGTALIDMYSKCGCLNDAISVFHSNFTDCEVNTPWNAMLSGYSQSGHSKDALELFIRMSIASVEMDHFTFGSVFNAIADLKYLQLTKQVHAVVIKHGYGFCVLNVDNSIADAYSKCGSLEDARNVFDRMKERDVVSWTTMVTAYSASSNGEEALGFFLQIMNEGIAPNQFTFASVLVGCSSLGLLEYGQQIHSLLLKGGFDGHDCIQSALIDMYSKCGSIREGEKVFEKIVSPDVVSWTAIISAYAQHGFASKALQSFKKMEVSGIKANSVTLLCVLFACSHVGMIEEGIHYFQIMEEKYGIVPEMEHYACIVDLYGRVGHLDDAIDFINNMPIEPTDMIWQTLLGACRVHRNVELGGMAARKILSVRPDDSAAYVLLSNTYSEKGILESGLSLRSMMRERGVKKEPGFSWISVGGKVSKFFSGDQRHHQKDKIFAKLEELGPKMKAMGYLPDLSYALKDLE